MRFIVRSPRSCSKSFRLDSHGASPGRCCRDLLAGGSVRLARWALAALLVHLPCGLLGADELSFERDVRPVLKQHCFQCHGEEADLRGGLDLRLVRQMHSGGDSGATIVPGDSASSLLYRRLRDGEMPPDESKLLTAAEVETIRKWIDAGATTLRPEPESAGTGLLITEEERTHWAFQPRQKPAVPQVNSTDLVRNPIDAFLLQRLEAQGLTFAPQASDTVLLRRLMFVLHGLPPASLGDVRLDTRMDGDSSGNVHSVIDSRLIDTLLDDEHYGERWARHWLDIVGYADSEGYTDEDQERPHAWRYRDYVIRSFNADKPFDEFIREQLAGDELITTPLNNLSASDAELLAATGFLRMAPDGTGGRVEDRGAAINDTIAGTLRIVSTSLLGLTVACAQCHDHRYDPISQPDYYRLRAIFEPALDPGQWRNPRQRLVSLYTDEDRTRAAAIEAEAAEVDKRRQVKQEEFIAATFEKEVMKLPAEIQETARQARQAKDSDRTPEQNALLKAHPSLNVSAGSLYLYDQKAADELKAMADEAATIRGRRPAEGFVHAITEVPGRIPDTHLFVRGDFQQRGDVVPPAGLAVLSMNADLPDIPTRADSATTSGRRLAFAERLTHPNHPLTARVIVNRVWLHLFGRGLVATPADFGILGERPTHPELLDWLACEFIESGWSLKHIHRLVLNSRAWQQQVSDDEALMTADPDNLLYGGARLRRVEAEVLRDSILCVSGLLKEKQFGPPVPVMADTVGRFVIGRENLNAGRPGEVIDMEGEQFRRSIYVQTRRSRPLSMLEAFDLPTLTPNCELRRPSTSATQSLMLMNSDNMIELSGAFARRIEREAGTEPTAQIRRAWELAYSRGPDESEIAEAGFLLNDLETDFATIPAGNNPKPDLAPAQQALNVLCQMLLSSNEFLYID